MNTEIKDENQIIDQLDNLEVQSETITQDAPTEETPKTEPVKKSRRGGARPGSGRKPKNPVKKAPVEKSDNTHISAQTSENIDDMISAFNDETQRRAAQDKPDSNAGDGVQVETEIIEAEKEGMAISGAFMMMVINGLFPFIIVGMYNWTQKDKRLRIEPSAVQLDDEQLDMIEPAAEEVAKMYLSKLPPFTLFLLHLGTFYALNTRDAITEAKNNLKDKKGSSK